MAMSDRRLVLVLLRKRFPSYATIPVQAHAQRRKLDSLLCRVASGCSANLGWILGLRSHFCLGCFGLKCAWAEEAIYYLCCTD